MAGSAELLGMPEVAAVTGRSRFAVARLLRRRPDIDRRLRRLGGRRLFTRADAEAIRRAFDQREGTKR